MDKDELIKALCDLDARLSTSYDIILIGGAAMILHFEADRTTRDVDVFVLRGSPSELRQAIKKVADEREIPENWMSDAAKGYADVLLPDFYHRLTPLDFNLHHIRLYSIGLPEQVALKIIALREQDLEDLELLLPKVTESDQKIIISMMNHVNSFRPDWAQKMRYFLLEQGWKID